MTDEITVPALSAAPTMAHGPALHASERHDDFERHAEAHPGIPDGFKSPKGAGAVHAKDAPGFTEAYRYDKVTGGYASTCAPTARRA